MIDAFEAAYPGIRINAMIEGVSEGDAGSLVIADVAAAPDIYCFAQDQLAGLVQAGALAGPTGDIAAAVKAENDASSVAAASLAGNLYAYPMTSDNGYFMYYDKSIISEEDAESLEAIIAACEANNVKFRYALENSWYTASFFFGAGCHSTWTTNEHGEFTSVDDNFNSNLGLIAMKGMQKLAKSPCYDSNADVFTDAGVVITGVWNAWAAAEHFGENLGATDLPSFEVDGKSYHIGSFSGNKLMGVKPQADAEKADVLALLAQWLTNEENQIKRYEQFNFGPSNLKAQTSPAVQSDISLAALLKQNNYAQPQGRIHGAWWDIARRLGAAARDAASEDDLKAALAEYDAVIQGLFGMSEAEKNAWSVIGSICGSSWDVDFPMYEVEPGVYLSDVMELHAGEEFKVRKGGNWDVNFGAAELNGPNFVVEKDGVYRVKLVWDGGQNGTVSLVPVE